MGPGPHACERIPHSCSEDLAKPGHVRAAGSHEIGPGHEGLLDGLTGQLTAALERPQGFPPAQSVQQ